MNKKVNVYPSMPIFTVYPPITQKQEGVELPLGKIEKCLIARAKVEQVFPNGETIQLNLKNYNKELQCNLFNKKEEPQPVKVEVKEEVAEEVKSEKEPQPVKVEVKEEVAEEVKVEETPVEETEVKEEVVTEEKNKPQENRKNKRR